MIMETQKIESGTVMAQSKVQILRGGHVIDPAQGIDKKADVTIRDGKIESVGGAPVSGAEIVDVSGCYVTPGWIDIHVHVYGTLGFADPDSIGVYQGVTSFIEAGGPGIDVMDEFTALTAGRTLTDLYAGVWALRPMGLISINFIEGDVRTLTNVPITKWLDYVKDNADQVRYLKTGAYGTFGVGPLRIARGLAEMVGKPLYVHIGEHQMQEGSDEAYEIYRIAAPGDIITHVFHGNKYGVLDESGRILPLVREAARRGVLFDVGFGGYNFSWTVGEKVMAQGLVPQIISSDLQQFNVIGPVYSLANVMTCCLRLGMSMRDVVQAVTQAPAKALFLEDRAGSLKPGLPADVTVFRMEQGEFELQDTQGMSRKADTRFTPVMAFKRGQRVECDMTRGQDERNWLIQIAEDAPPQAASRLSDEQRHFLAALAVRLSRVHWDESHVEKFSLEKAIELHDTFRSILAETRIPLKAALNAVFDCFLAHPFTMQVGVFLLRQPRAFVLSRLNEVAGPQLKVA
jgi:dihydroorotase